ncbi:hypothetical protein ACWGR4_34125 [Embleya sp. NPDC055664]
MDVTPLSVSAFVVAAVAVMRLAALADANLKAREARKSWALLGYDRRAAGWDPCLVYWDPLPMTHEVLDVPTAPDAPDAVGDRLANGHPFINGRWADRSWLSVPGPFFIGAGGVGPDARMAAAHFLADDGGLSFVHRQPRTPREVCDFLGVAAIGPAGGCGWDGDEYWTPAAVRAWWADRDRVRAWIDARLADPDPAYHDPATLRAFAAHLDHGLEDYLRGYLFWLITGRQPTRHDPLPPL